MERQMYIKKVIVIVLLFSFVLLTSRINVQASVDEDGLIEEQLEIFDFSEFTDAAEDLKKDNVYISNISIKEMIRSFISGDVDLTINNILNEFAKQLFKEIFNQLYLMRKIVMICLIAAILNTISDSFKSKAVAELGFYACYIVLIIALIESFGIASFIVSNTTESLYKMMLSLAPIFTAFYVLGGFASVAAVVNPIIIAAVHFIVMFIKSVILPFISFTATVEFVNHLSEGALLNKMSELMKKIIKYMLRAAAGVVIFLLSIQAAAAPAINRFLNNSAKAIVKSVPVVGEVLAGAVDSVASLSGLVKSGTATVVIIFFILSSILPIIKLLAMSLTLKFTAAIVEPIVDKRLVTCIDSVGNFVSLLLACLAIVLILFIFIIFIVLITSRPYIG